MNDSMTKLDSLCAVHGFAIVEDITDNKKAKERENHITNSIGVLQENGVYAFFLYLEYRQVTQIKNQSLNLLRHDKIELINKSNDHFEDIRKLTENLDDLLFARQLLEQMLIYARYHAKAKGETS